MAGARKGTAASQVKLSLNTLQELQNGVIQTAFDRDLEFLIRDIVDRPLDKRPRTLNLSLSLTPDPDESGICDQASAAFVIKAQVPSRKSRTFNLAVKPNGTAMVNPDNPGSANQGMLHEVRDDEGDIDED